MDSICEECDAEYLGAGVWDCPDGCSLDSQRNEKKNDFSRRKSLLLDGLATG